MSKGRTQQVSKGRATAGAVAVIAALLLPNDMLRAQVSAPPAAGPTKDYLAFVVSESADQISLIRFGPAGAKVERQVKTGLMPAEINGPHGVAVAPDGRHYYVTVAHGTPWGTIWKYTTAGDTVVGRVELGMFPASLQVTPDGMFAFVVNFNLHGDMVPSSVSVVYTPEMMEVARIQTCTMPHGSRMNPQGTKQYSTCMMDDMLVEIDTRTLSVARHFMLQAGKEHGMAGAPKHDHGGGSMPAASCSPTWAQPSSTGAKIYIACNKSDEIVEVDTESWSVNRRIKTAGGPYNLAVTRDGKLLVVTNKRGQSVSVFSLETGQEVAKVATKRKIVHGVAITPDDRYAFISVEGIGSEPGTVEIIDLATFKTVATVDVGQQAGGIDIWKMEPPK